MKETIKTSRTAGYLEKIFRALNAKYFNGELEEPIITIQSTPRAYGHVTVAKAWQRGDTTRHELNIGAGTLARPIENVVASTLHECVHLWNIQNGIQDCSRGGQYHNKKFKYAAEARDLKISYDSRIGWSITEPTDALCEFILDQGWEDIRIVLCCSSFLVAFIFFFSRIYTSKHPLLLPSAAQHSHRPMFPPAGNIFHRGFCTRIVYTDVRHP